MFSPAEKLACRRLVELALGEDLGSEGDVTSRAVIPIELRGSARFVARSAGVVAGPLADDTTVRRAWGHIADAETDSVGA